MTSRVCEISSERYCSERSIRTGVAGDTCSPLVDKRTGYNGAFVLIFFSAHSKTGVRFVLHCRYMMTGLSTAIAIEPELLGPVLKYMVIGENHSLLYVFSLVSTDAFPGQVSNGMPSTSAASK